MGKEEDKGIEIENRMRSETRVRSEGYLEWGVEKE